MSKIYIILGLFFLSLFNTSCDSTATKTTEQSETKEAIEETTFILVRHAEKEKVKDNPGLTKEGQERADKLAFMLQDITLDAIYSTDYKRTKDTAQPTATSKQMEVTLYNPSDLQLAKDEMLSKHRGKTILIVGHSNSTPNFLNQIAGPEKASPIDESVYSKLFIVKHRSQDDADVLLLRF